MKRLNRYSANTHPLFPNRIMQFGGGNFLRGFVDWMIDVYNEKTDAQLGILVVKPTERGDYRSWREQEGLFHVLTKGIRNGELVDEKHLVKCVSQIIHPYLEFDSFLASAKSPNLRYIISNTTENGIRFSKKDFSTDMPPKEFPAKLALWLYARFDHFKGAKNAGCILLPTELLEDNGDKLKHCILQYAEKWKLGVDFEKWIEESNIFCNSLVDRIIPGVGKDEQKAARKSVGFEDEMITQGEPYHLWAIEAPQSVREELPLDKIGLNIIYTDDLTPYRTSKVRILNGAHTSMVPVGYLAGIDTVREAVEDEVIGKFIRQAIFEEIIPSLNLPEVDVEKFAGDVLDRFKNPFIKHRLISISLNCVSKYKTRVLPSVLAFQKEKGHLPKALVFSLAALIRFYKGTRSGEPISLNDAPEVIDFFKKLWSSESDFSKITNAVLGNTDLWAMDLTEVEGLEVMVSDLLKMIETEGVALSVEKIL